GVNGPLRLVHLLVGRFGAGGRQDAGGKGERQGREGAAGHSPRGSGTEQARHLTVRIRGRSVREGPWKGLSASERPREKLSRAGAGALGDNELVALVLGAGTRARDALSIAQHLIETAGGSDGLARLSTDELKRIPGVGLARAARLVAAVELGRRA